MVLWCRHDTPQACAGGPILSLRRQPEVLAEVLVPRPWDAGWTPPKVDRALWRYASLVSHSLVAYGVYAYVGVCAADARGPGEPGAVASG